jgi:di/tricarboxylate transporter
MQTSVLVAILAAALVLLVTQWVRIEIVSLGLICVLAASGILDAGEALSGFSSPATVTVAAMLVLSAGLERSGVVDRASARLARWARGGDRRLLAVTGAPVAGFSAFMNNTPVVALMIPVALTLARRFAIAPSKLLIPISYFSILGGTCTLIGTSTNILVDSLYRQHGGAGFGMFEFLLLGLPFLAVGGLYVLAFSWRLLPVRTALSELLSAHQPGHFVTEIVVPAGSRLVGKRLAEALGEDEETAVLELVRDEETHLLPEPSTPIEDGDILLLESNARVIHRLLDRADVEFGTAVADEERVTIQRADRRIAEAVITPNSRFIHKKVKELGLSRRYGVYVLAIRRLGRRHQYQLRELRLQSGDVLLVQGETAALRLLQEEGDALLVEAVQRELTFSRKAPAALMILGAVVLLASLGVAPIVFLALAGVAAMIALRVLDVTDALRALDPSVVLLLAGTIPLGLAMEKTGLAASIAGQVASVASAGGPTVLVGSFYLLTTLMTSVLSNNATAVLLAPIGLGLARELGVDPRPLLVAIAYGASASFATPIGYQTNLLVMGPGGYQFRDYLRIGLPMSVLLAITATLLIPRIWPL